MYQKIDIENWKRKEHYAFFRQFHEPYFGITTELDAAPAYRYCKETRQSFFLYYHYLMTKVVNELEPFRYRILGDGVVICDVVHLSTTVLRDDQTFAFSFMPYAPRFEDFSASAQVEIERIKQSSGLGLSDKTERFDVVHCSTLPWVRFSSIAHARMYGTTDSIPKFSFGKYVWEGERLMLPISIHVHHALVDGLHVGQYLEKLQSALV